MLNFEIQTTRMRATFVFVSILLFIVNSPFVKAQELLKLSKSHPVYYFPGNTIKIETEPDKQKLEGRIDSIGNNFITVDGNTIPLKEISAVYIRRDKVNIFSEALILCVAGIGYLGITAFNGLLVHHNAVTSSTYAVSGGLFAGGIVLFTLRQRKITISKKHSLQTVGIDHK
jgi:hypothetical protein